MNSKLVAHGHSCLQNIEHALCFLIIFETFLPLLGRLGSFIFLSNLFKISSMDLPAIIDD